MSYKNKDKHLEEGAIFHAYNRGYEKRIIFKDRKDYVVFMYLLKKYLKPGFKLNSGLISLESNHLYNEVDLYAFCLMSNHFHLLLKQTSKYGMTKLVTRISSSYAKYYNVRYKREGQLWQGTYRAVRIYSDRQFYQAMDYIHKNPLDTGIDTENYDFSSYSAHLGKVKYGWLITSGLPW